MLDRIRPWLGAHPRWTLCLLVSAALGPFLAKPLNLDDPLFIWLAQQVQVHPADPFGFGVNWYGRVSPFWAVTDNPPVAGYYFAAAGDLFGWSELGFHLGGLLAALAAIWGTHRLALRLAGQPLLATCAVLFTPVFLVSAGTVMSDVLMLSFWVWAIVFWVEGLEQNRFLKIFFAGTLVALALLTKYFGVALLPLLAVHGALEKRKLGSWSVGLLIPLAALGVYQWITLELYGHALFSTAAGYATSVQSELGFSSAASGLIALAFTGGGMASAFFLAPSLWRTRTLATIAGGTTILGGALCCSGLVLQKYHALASPVARMEVSVQLIFWSVGGVLVLLLAVADVWKNARDPRSWLLALWVAGTFVFAAFANWTVNGRSLLPMSPAVGILIARRWEYAGLKRPRMLTIGLAASALLALLVTQSDFQLALAVRRSAQEAFPRYRQEGTTVWFEGHWGFQYYMEKLGATAVDFKNRTQQPGDILVVPLHNTDSSEVAPEIVARRDVLAIPNPSWLTTWQAAVGAGFYASVLGPLPFAFGKNPPESLFIYELKPPASATVK
jgi:4-amino-4-deoxy-L-arabinose transferase-like glycosyltransferase